MWSFLLPTIDFIDLSNLSLGTKDTKPRKGKMYLANALCMQSCVHYFRRLFCSVA